MKHRKKIVLGALIIVVIALVATLLLRERTPEGLTFYTYSTAGKVSRENKDFAKVLYDGYSDDVSEIIVAEDGRSGKNVRWVFMSDEALTIDMQQAILDDIYTHMTTSAEWVIRVWEVYFCRENVIYSMYVATYDDADGDGSINRSEFTYTDWYEVPNAAELISRDALEHLLRNPVEYLYSWKKPLEEQTPRIPKG